MTEEDIQGTLAGQQKEPPLVERAYEVRAEMKVRHSELKSVSERLDHILAVPRARKWELRSQVVLGAVGGGFIGLIPFVALGPPLIAWGAYVVALVVALYFGLTYSDAANDVAAERADSILAIKEHIDKNMLTTEAARLQAPTPTRRLEPAGPAPAGAPPSPLAPRAEG